MCLVRSSPFAPFASLFRATPRSLQPVRSTPLRYVPLPALPFRLRSWTGSFAPLRYALSPSTLLLRRRYTLHSLRVIPPSLTSDATLTPCQTAPRSGIGRDVAHGGNLHPLIRTRHPKPEERSTQEPRRERRAPAYQSVDVHHGRGHPCPLSRSPRT